MNRDKVKKGLSRYLVKRDEHLALNMVQAEQLAHYAMLYIDKYMSPKYSGEHQDSYSVAMGERCEWSKK